MAVIHLPNGVGEATGDSLVTNSPLEINGNVWYVDASTGVDAASPAGRNRNKPLASLSQAITNCGDGDVIVCMDGHTETLTSALSIDQDVLIVGAGSSSGLPTVKFTINAASAALFSFAGGALSTVGMRNIWIEENAQANSVSKLVTGGSLNYLFLDGLYVECDGNDDAVALDLDVDQCARIDNCTFISTSTDNTAQPAAAIALRNTPVLQMKGTTFSGGTVGWSNYFAMYPAAAGPDYMQLEELSLLLGADIQLTESSQGFVSVTTATGGARVDWCDVTDPA